MDNFKEQRDKFMLEKQNKEQEKKKKEQEMEKIEQEIEEINQKIIELLDDRHQKMENDMECMSLGRTSSASGLVNNSGIKFRYYI
jgi:hypothetical protein